MQHVGQNLVIVLFLGGVSFNKKACFSPPQNVGILSCEHSCTNFQNQNGNDNHVVLHDKWSWNRSYTVQSKGGSNCHWPSVHPLQKKWDPWTGDYNHYRVTVESCLAVSCKYADRPLVKISALWCFVGTYCIHTFSNLIRWWSQAARMDKCLVRVFVATKAETAEQQQHSHSTLCKHVFPRSWHWIVHINSKQDDCPKQMQSVLLLHLTRQPNFGVKLPSDQVVAEINHINLMPIVILRRPTCIVTTIPNHCQHRFVTEGKMKCPSQVLDNMTKLILVCVSSNVANSAIRVSGQEMSGLVWKETIEKHPPIARRAHVQVDLDLHPEQLVWVWFLQDLA